MNVNSWLNIVEFSVGLIALAAGAGLYGGARLALVVLGVVLCLPAVLRTVRGR